MTGVATGLLAAIILTAQAQQPVATASASTGSERVWERVEFPPVPPSMRAVEQIQAEPKPCSRMPVLKVDASLDPKFVWSPPNVPKSHMRIVGGELTLCPAR